LVIRDDCLSIIAAYLQLTLLFKYDNGILFLDVYSLKKIGESARNLQGAPPDEFGIRQLNVPYN